MEIKYALQHYLFLASLVTGVVCGAVYDVFRILRAFAFKSRAVVFVEDVIYCLFVSAAFMMLFYNYSEGRIRFFAFVGVAAGFSAYYFTVGRLTREVFEAVRKFILYLARKTRRTAVCVFRSAYGRHYSLSRIRASARVAKKGFGF